MPQPGLHAPHAWLGVGANSAVSCAEAVPDAVEHGGVRAAVCPASSKFSVADSCLHRGSVRELAEEKEVVSCSFSPFFEMKHPSLLPLHTHMCVTLYGVKAKYPIGNTTVALFFLFFLKICFY